MKPGLCNRIILFMLLVLCSFSCSSDLDFEQANDFNIQPVFTTNLAYLEAKAPDFVENGMQQPIFSYFTNVDFFRTSFIEEDLVKAELYFRIKNTINRAYTFDITFLDVNNIAIYNIRMDVVAYNGTETLVEKTVPFTAADVDILKRTSKMVFTVVMRPGPPLTETSPGRVELSSSITAYFDIE